MRWPQSKANGVRQGECSVISDARRPNGCTLACTRPGPEQRIDCGLASRQSEDIEAIDSVAGPVHENLVDTPPMIAAYMNNHRLDTLIREHADVVHAGSFGNWKFEYRDHGVMVLTDESNNRMRIITPVAEVAELSDEIWLIVLSANFDRALDARYAVAGDYLWSAFIHPLRQLEESQFLDGLDQVVTLAENFGTTFSSGDLMFRGELDEAGSEA